MKTQASKICYRKSRRAQSKDDFETWIESSTTNTINCFDIGDIRTTTVIVEVNERQNEKENNENAV